MSVNPDIHDKAYQFFIEEAAELLQIIEDGILELRRDRGANTVHAVMRAAHSIKGGAASVELEAIKTIAHRMETAFRALYDETVEIDDELEGLLLDGFDCLKDPLNEQIDTGSHDPEAALGTAMPVIEALEAKLGADVLKQADNYIPSSSDLGIDMVTSIFEIDVEEGIAHLEAVAENPGNFPVLGELQAQAEVFVGFGELLDLPGFGAIAEAILNACHHSPDDPIALLTIALQDLHAAKELVMGGDRDQGGAPSEALLALAGGSSDTASETLSSEVELSAGDFADFGLSEADLANFDFANGDLSALTDSQNEVGREINPQTSELEGNLTDAGLGELDLAALTMEGDALLETAEVIRSDNNLTSDETVGDDTASFDFGSDDFQALIDESSDLEISTGSEDEFSTMEQAEINPGSAPDEALVSNELLFKEPLENEPLENEPLENEPLENEPLENGALVNELDAGQSDSVDFASLDAMAQLADLMAAPDTSQAEPLLETIESETHEGAAPLSEESDLAGQGTEDSFGGDSSLELETGGIEESFVEDSGVALALGDEDESTAESVQFESTFDLVTEAVSLGIQPEHHEDDEIAAGLESDSLDSSIVEVDFPETALTTEEPSLTASEAMLPEGAVTDVVAESIPESLEQPDTAGAMADDDALATSESAAPEQTGAEGLPAEGLPAEDLPSEASIPGFAAPDAELENMWAELDDNLDDHFGDNCDATQESDLLDQTFDMAMDDAEVVATSVSLQSQENSEASALEEDKLADIFANEEIAPKEEQDNTTPLSVAEADAAFEALVDASTENEANGLDESDISLDLSFDDDIEPSVPMTDNSQNLGDIFTLENVAETEPAAEGDLSDRSDPIPPQSTLEPTAVEESSLSTNSLNEDQELLDPWASQSLETTANSAQLISEGQALALEGLNSADLDEQSEEVGNPAPEMTASFEALDVPATPDAEVEQADALESLHEAMPDEDFAEQDPLQDEPSEAQNTSPSADAEAEEVIDDGTFIQNLDMGTFIQTDDAALASEAQAVGNDEPPVEEVSAQDHDTSGLLDAQLGPIEMMDETAEPLEMDPATPDVTGQSEMVEAQAEPFEEGTFIQTFEEGTFIQGVTDAVVPTSGLEQSSVSETEENFDEGTFVQGIDEGTFIQGITDAVVEEPQPIPEAGDEWNSPIDEDAEGLSEAANGDEALIPELQAFIDQAAAESASSVAKADESSSAVAESVAPTLDGSAREQSEIAGTESATAEPILSESVHSEFAGTEAAIAEPDLEAAVQPIPEAAAEESPTELREAVEAEAQGDETANLPSLETMFAVEPERLAAIANDSLTAELMTAPELEAVQLIQNSEPSSRESRPSPAPEAAVEATVEATVEAKSSQTEADEAGAAPADEPASSTDAIVGSDTSDSDTSSDDAGSGSPPIVNAAVEVALAEHQAVEPRGTADEASPAPSAAPSDSINNAVMAVEQMFSQLPANSPLPSAQTASTGSDSLSKAAASKPEAEAKAKKVEKKKRQQGTKLSGISVRVDLSVLERMNNLVGELVLSRNSLSMQHEQLQSVVTQLDKRFNNFEGQLNGLRGISDQMLVEPAQRQAAAKQQSSSTSSGLNAAGRASTADNASTATGEEGSLLEGFDVLEMDRYSALHGQLQEIFEQLMQLEEGVDDIGVLLEQSTQSLTQQRQRLSLLQNELMWARMLPLDNILGRFPRVLRDMARKHGKSVDLNMNGTSVLVDKGMLEKLHDPMLHLLRNAFDHGIEKPQERASQGKSERGEIQINAYYQGNQTVIEIKDDGQGVNLERIAKRAVELQWLSREEIKSIPQQTLLDLIFEPGFSTAAKLSELSGRGVGLDVVREQIKDLKGNVTVDYEKGKGTTFTLRLPLTLTVAKLMVCQVGTTAIALPSDGIEDLLVPQPEQLKMVGNKRLLHWRDDLIPIHSMSDLLDYSCPTADIASLKAITSKSIPVPKDWALPMLIFSRGSQRCAMEVNRLLMEQELVIKPFSSAMTPPEYSYGCTILGDGRMIPVLDGTALLQQLSDQSIATAAGVELSEDLLDDDTLDGVDVTATMAQAMQADTLLVVDDSTAMRRTMALSLEKAGYRVLQAGDGQEALTQLRQSNAIQLVICDVEMPNMNGFEFLSQRRREPMLMKIPVVMLTSRSSDKHRRLAMQLKAHDYFSKPYVEQEFLKSIKQILANQEATAKV